MYTEFKQYAVEDAIAGYRLDTKSKIFDFKTLIVFIFKVLNCVKDKEHNLELIT